MKQESLPMPNLHPITISVSQKRILTRALTKLPMGIKDTVQAHYDLIVEICHLLSLLPIPVTLVHIPGQGVMHYTNGNESMTPQQIPINPNNLTEKRTQCDYYQS
jgi:hypothetical protein